MGATGNTEVSTRARREAIRDLWRLGGGLLAAGVVGCGAQTSAASAPVPTATSTPIASPTVAPTLTPTPLESLRLSIAPSALAIPALELSAPVETARTVRNAQGRPEIVVPDHGVVSPNLGFGRNGANNVWILGHSRWQGVPQLMFRLQHVRRGDLVTIAGFERTRRQELPALDFHVDSLVIADLESATAEIYGARPRVPRLVLQTSARQSGETTWILDRRLMETHAEFRVRGGIDDLTSYLVLLVTATVTPHSLAALLRPTPDTPT